ncbi:MAG: DUF1573 domain-containing protein [Bacteroidetes bacterium]|nr:DUF1573 domain-containing protein [Bacteroidota bacterium]
MRILSICFFVFVIASCGSTDKKSIAGLNTNSAAMDSSKFTTIEWLDSANKNFGKIGEGRKLDVTFRFKNTGDKPLIIQKVQPSCGCTVAEQPNEPVLPGEEGVIKASFNSEGRIGINHKTLYVTANTKKTQSHELHFEVEVEKKKW